MKEEAEGGGAATRVGDKKEPAKDLLCHLEGLGVCHQEKDERGIKCILCLQGEIYTWGGFSSHSVGTGERFRV